MAGALGGGWPSPQADSFRAAKVMGRSKAPEAALEYCGGWWCDSVFSGWRDGWVDGLRHGCVG